MTSESNKENITANNLESTLAQFIEELNEYSNTRQEFLDEYYPIDIPNEVCNYAFIQGIKFENSFKPKVNDFVHLMGWDDEELFLWTHTKDTYTALVSKVSTRVKEKNFWKNSGRVIQLAYAYSTDFDHNMEIDYKWCYYFDSNKSISEQEIYDCDELDRYNLLNGNILKLSDLSSFFPIIELLLRDDKAYTAISNFYTSMQTHYCCLICELNPIPYKKHPSHEPKIWEQAKIISDFESAIVQACRCVEALIGKPPNKEKTNRFLEHKRKWINEIGINPDDEFIKGKTTYIDFYYKLFDLRNEAAHSYGTIPFDLERLQTVEAQCFASLLLDGYINKNILSSEVVTEKLKINQKLIDQVDHKMSTPRTFPWTD